MVPDFELRFKKHLASRARRPMHIRRSSRPSCMVRPSCDLERHEETAGSSPKSPYVAGEGSDLVSLRTQVQG